MATFAGSLYLVSMAVCHERLDASTPFETSF